MRQKYEPDHDYDYDPQPDTETSQGPVGEFEIRRLWSTPALENAYQLGKKDARDEDRMLKESQEAGL